MDKRRAEQKLDALKRAARGRPGQTLEAAKRLEEALTGPASPPLDSGSHWFFIPVRTHNPLNGNYVHWAVRSKDRKRHRAAVWAAWLGTPQPERQAMLEMAESGAVVLMERLTTKKMDDPTKMDDDGLRAALKSVRDGIAEQLCIDDGDSRVEWHYNQVTGRKGEFGVRVTVMRK